jgi:hypothetical protein
MGSTRQEESHMAIALTFDAFFLCGAVLLVTACIFGVF